MEVIQRAVSVADVHVFSRQNTLPDIFFGSGDRIFQGISQGKAGGDGRRECASGSMRIVAFHFICRKQMRFRFVLHLQQIIHPASVKMASLDQYCPASQFQQLVGGGLHRLLSVDADSGEHLCFAQVGGE